MSNAIGVGIVGLGQGQSHLQAFQRLGDARAVSEMDEAFHQGLVIATVNAEIARLHRDITEKIRIIRPLAFTKGGGITATYAPHDQI